MLASLRLLVISVTLAAYMVGCGTADTPIKPANNTNSSDDHDHDGDDHDHDGDDHDHDGDDHDHDGDDHDHDGDDHDHDGDGHDDHDHDAEDHDDDHGDSRPLGIVMAGTTEFDVAIAGDIVPGEEVSVDLNILKGDAPASVRVWIGDEAGTDSLKSKTDGHDDHFHGHVEVPSTLGADARLWIEAEAADGTRTKASLPLS